MNRREPIRPRGGMSLVELVAALAILALAAAMLATVFGGGLSILRRGMARRQGADSAYAALALGEGEGSPATVTFEIGGRTYTVPGTVEAGQDGDTGAVFRVFVPGETP